MEISIWWIFKWNPEQDGKLSPKLRQKRQPATFANRLGQAVNLRAFMRVRMTLLIG
jgi:hypothetical protein